MSLCSSDKWTRKVIIAKAIKEVLKKEHSHPEVMTNRNKINVYC